MEPAYPLIPVPDPDALAVACLPDLVSLARDLASWTESLDGGVLPPDVEDDLEQLGRRAEGILRRLRSETAGDRELDAALEELDRHAV